MGHVCTLFRGGGQHKSNGDPICMVAGSVPDAAEAPPAECHVARAASKSRQQVMGWPPTSVGTYIDKKAFVYRRG